MGSEWRRISSSRQGINFTIEPSCAAYKNVQAKVATWEDIS